MASPPVRGPDAAEMHGASPATGTSPAQTSGDSEDVAVVTAPPAKKRRVWPVGEVGARVDILCVSAVTASGAHLADWGQGDKLYEFATGIFNEQTFRPFVVDG